MNINSLTASGLLNPAQMASAAAQQGRVQQSMSPVAQLLGENAQKLMSDLQAGGTSLNALAQSKGVSSTALVNAIKQGLQKGANDGGPPLSDTQLTNLANTIANRVHSPHHHHTGGVSTAPAAAATPGSTVAPLADSQVGGSSTTSPTTSAMQLDVQRLMFDLQNMQANATSSATGTTSAASTAAASSTWSSSATSALLNQISQFDQTL